MNRGKGHCTGESENTHKLNDLEAAKLLLDAWKFRQTHCWKSLQTFFVAAVVVSTLPYVMKQEVLALLRKVRILFPLGGGVIGLAAVWLYAAEFVRCRSLNS